MLKLDKNLSALKNETRIVIGDFLVVYEYYFLTHLYI